MNDDDVLGNCAKEFFALPLPTSAKLIAPATSRYVIRGHRHGLQASGIKFGYVFDIVVPAAAFAVRHKAMYVYVR